MSKICRKKKVLFKNKSINIGRKEKKKRNIYTKKALQKAVEAVKNGSSYRKAAKLYFVPLTAVFRAMKSPSQLDGDCKTPSKCTVFSVEEEKEICDYILYRAERGYPITKLELLDCVQSYVIQNKKTTCFTEGRPGRHWYEVFLRRHPNLTIRTAQHLTLNRASVTEEDLRDWFKEVETYLNSKSLVSVHPSRIYNCDETNIQLMPKPAKVLTKKGASTVYKIVDGGKKESLTALFMYNAEGTRAPPMLVFKYKESAPKSIVKDFPSEWGLGISDHGWMTTETFYEYVSNVFYPWLLKNQIEFPVILYLDGHSSHVTLPLVKFCREKKLKIISLYSNATHILQPLDIALFHPFKEIWKKTVAKWKVENGTINIKKDQFAIVLQKALQSFSEEKNIVKNGFRAAGLFPFDPNAVDYDVLQKKKKKKKCNVINQEIQETTEDSKQHLLKMESNLPKELLEDFKRAESSGLMTLDIKNQALFEYWLKVKKSTCGINFF